jgi:DNA-binding MarR family transcriptional regulator
MADIDKLMEQWRRERPSLDLEAMELGMRLVRVASELGHALLELHARHGIPPGGFDVLAALRRSGKPYELTPTQLYESLLLASGTLTNRLDRLEAKGLIRRKPDPEDGRGHRVQLTERGQTRVEVVLGEHVKLEANFFAKLPTKDRRSLLRLLTKLG